MGIKWNKQLKEELSYLSAFIAFIFGMVITVWGFATDPQGEVHDSVLWILGQMLIYSASVFGVGMFISSEIKGIRKELGLKEKKDLED